MIHSLKELINDPLNLYDNQVHFLLSSMLQT
jgi:hypothetical protein